MYAYKPENGKWNLIAWDIDFLLDNGGDPTTTAINPASMPIGDPTNQDAALLSAIPARLLARDGGRR